MVLLLHAGISPGALTAPRGLPAPNGVVFSSHSDNAVRKARRATNPDRMRICAVAQGCTRGVCLDSTSGKAAAKSRGDPAIWRSAWRVVVSANVSWSHAQGEVGSSI